MQPYLIHAAFNHRYLLRAVDDIPDYSLCFWPVACFHHSRQPYAVSGSPSQITKKCAISVQKNRETVVLKINVNDFKKLRVNTVVSLTVPAEKRKCAVTHRIQNPHVPCHNFPAGNRKRSITFSRRIQTQRCAAAFAGLFNCKITCEKKTAGIFQAPCFKGNFQRNHLLREDIFIAKSFLPKFFCNIFRADTFNM